MPQLRSSQNESVAQKNEDFAGVKSPNLPTSFSRIKHALHALLSNLQLHSIISYSAQYSLQQP
jgi:hypothetical protein